MKLFKKEKYFKNIRGFYFDNDIIKVIIELEELANLV